MRRAGVSQDVAMSISGHKTDSMFRRYNITDTEDQRQTLAKVQGTVSSRPPRKCRNSRSASIKGVPVLP